MKRTIRLTSIAMLLTGFLFSSCASQQMCKSKKKYYKSQKCWNAKKKQKMTRC